MYLLEQALYVSIARNLEYYHSNVCTCKDEYLAKSILAKPEQIPALLQSLEEKGLVAIRKAKTSGARLVYLTDKTLGVVQRKI